MVVNYRLVDEEASGAGLCWVASLYCHFLWGCCNPAMENQCKQGHVNVSQVEAERKTENHKKIRKTQKSTFFFCLI